MRRSSLVSKLTWVMVSVSVVPAVLIATVFWLGARARLQSEALHRLDVAAEVHGQLLQRIALEWLRESQSFTTRIAVREDLAAMASAATPASQKAARRDEVEAALMSLTNGGMGVESAAFILSARDGSILAAAGATDACGASLRYSPEFLSARSAPWISEPYSLPSVPDTVVDIVQTIPAPSEGALAVGALVRCILITQDVRPYLLDYEDLGLTGELILVDRRNRLIADLRAQPRKNLGAPLEAAALRDLLNDNPGAHPCRDDAGRLKLAAHREIAITGWKIILQMDAAEAYAGLRSLPLYLLVTALVLLVAAATVARAVGVRIVRPLLQLSATASRIAEGDLDAHFTLERDDELGTLAKSVKVMVERLKTAQRELEELVTERTRELREANEQLQQSEVALRKLNAELATVEESQRRELAAQLHDTVVQLLSLASLKLQVMRRQSADETQQESIDELLEIVAQAVAESRGLLARLSPPLLYDVGLVPALRRLAEEFEAQHGLSVAILPEGEVEPLDDSARGLLFHATRELLMNVVKHAQATRAEVRLARGAHQLTVAVQDDGVGLRQGEPRPQDQQGGFGLFSIRERLKLVGGSLTVENAPEGGVAATLEYPVGPREAPSEQG